jgi:hypothetical protein
VWPSTNLCLKLSTLLTGRTAIVVITRQLTYFVKNTLLKSKNEQNPVVFCFVLFFAGRAGARRADELSIDACSFLKSGTK